MTATQLTLMALAVEGLLYLLLVAAALQRGQNERLEIGD